MAGPISDKDDVVLGSGELYILAYTKGNTVPEDATIEAEANKVGHIKGGATLTYTPTFKTVVDDMGVVVKHFLTQEEVIFKSGLLSWNETQLKMLIQTGKVASEAKGMKVLKIGGRKNYVDQAYVVHFVHTKDDGQKKIKVTIVGSSTKGLEIKFDPENETIIDAEFKAISQDTDGTLVIYKEGTPTA